MTDDITIKSATEDLFDRYGLSSSTSTVIRRRRQLSNEPLGTNYTNVITTLQQENIRRGLDLLRGFYSGKQWDFNLIINDAEFLRHMDATSGNNVVFERTLFAAKQEFEPIVKKILLKIFEISTEGLADGAFPKEYRVGLQAAVNQLPDANVTGSRPHNVEVTLPDLYLHLGDYGDYEKGFHDQALLAKFQNPRLKDRTGANTPAHQLHPFADRVTLPWSESQLLKESRAGKRYQAWSALYRGEKGFLVPGGWVRNRSVRGRGEDEDNLDLAGRGGLRYSPAHFVEFPAGSSWRQTKKDRLVAWGSKAPYWLILELGQPNYEPKVVPVIGKDLNVISKITERFLKGERKATKGSLAGGLLPDVFGTNLRFETEIVGYRKGGRPANITVAWIEACHFAWTSIITRVWAEQLAAFNAGSLGVPHPSNPQSLLPAGSAATTETGPTVKYRGITSYKRAAADIRRNAEDFNSAIDRIMSDFDEFGG